MLKHFSIPNLRRKHLANSPVSLRFKICHQDVSACVASTQHLSNFRLQAWSSTDRHDIRFQSFTHRFFPVFIYYPNLATNGSSKVGLKRRFLECISQQNPRSSSFFIFYNEKLCKKIASVRSFRNSIKHFYDISFSFASDFSKNHFRRHNTDSLNSSLSKDTHSLQNWFQNLDCYFVLYPISWCLDIRETLFVVFNTCSLLAEVSHDVVRDLCQQGKYLVLEKDL